MDTDAAAFAEFYSCASDDCLRVVLATGQGPADRRGPGRRGLHAGMGVLAQGQQASRAAGVGGAHRAEHPPVVVVAAARYDAGATGTAQLTAWTVQKQTDGTIDVTIRELTGWLAASWLERNGVEEFPLLVVVTPLRSFAAGCSQPAGGHDDADGDEYDPGE